MGYIGLQGKHAGAPVYFRNVKVKEIEANFSRKEVPPRERESIRTGRNTRRSLPGTSL